MDQERQERVAHNEAAVRELNEKFGLGTFVCECGNIDCHAIVRMPFEVYDSIRSDSRRFFLKPGHEQPETEDVVVRRKEFFVVRKHDNVSDIVDERDPRRARR
jgi:hypothetical protein